MTPPKENKSLAELIENFCEYITRNPSIRKIIFKGEKTNIIIEQPKKETK